MAKRHHEVSDEILELIAETIEETSAQIGCRHDDQMIEIDQDTPKTVPLSAKIAERYTISHLLFYSETVSE